MAYVADRVLDLGLNVLDTEATNVEICSAEPSTYTAATSTNNLGTKSYSAGGYFGAPAAGSPNGRAVTGISITDGTTSVQGSAGFWAVTDRTNSRLLAAGAVASAQTVYVGNPWQLGAITVRIPAAA